MGTRKTLLTWRPNFLPDLTVAPGPGHGPAAHGSAASSGPWGGPRNIQTINTINTN